MHRVNSAGSSESYSYWSGRALETEFRLSQTEGSQLRGVYSQLIGHYQRMAQLYDVGAGHRTLAQHCAVSSGHSFYDAFWCSKPVSRKVDERKPSWL